MPKKKAGRMEKQLTLRVPADLYTRLENAANKLLLDQTALARLILAEKLPEYERRAQGAAPQGCETEGDADDGQTGKP